MRVANSNSLGKGRVTDVAVRNPWARIAFGAWALTFEASWVIGLRSLKIAAGGASAAAEMQLMLREKVEASVALQDKMLNGDLGASAPSAAAKVLALYRRKVRANRRRLVLR